MGYAGQMLYPIRPAVLDAAPDAVSAPAASPTPAQIGALPAAGGSNTTAAAPAMAAPPIEPTRMTASALSSMAGAMQGATTYTPSDNALVANQLNKGPSPRERGRRRNHRRDGAGQGSIPARAGATA